MITGYMSEAFLRILSLSLSGALVGAVILLIHPLTEKVFSRKWNYYIWFIIIIRLILPVQFTDSLPGGIRFDIRNFSQEEAVAGAEMEGAEEAMDGTGPGNPVGVIAGTEPEGIAEAAASVELESLEEAVTGAESENTTESIAGTRPESLAETVARTEPEDTTEPEVLTEPETGHAYAGHRFWLMGAAVLWLVGAMTAVFFKLRNYRRFILYIRKGAYPVTDRQITILTQSMTARLHVRKMPPVYRSASVSGPVTVGLWKPVIFLPETDSLTQYQYQLILHHELVHVARRDLWFKWLYQLLLCIHWFNPVFYWTDRRMNLDCELSCDEAVLALLTQEGRKLYGNVLLDIAERNAVSMKSALATTFVTGNSELKRRLQNVLAFKKTTIIKGALSAGVMAGMLFLTACGSVYLSDGDEAWEEEAFGWNDNGWENFFDAGKYDKEGDAYLAYDNAELLAGEDVSDKWQAFNYSGGGNGVSISRFLLDGTETIRIIYAEEERDIEITSEFDLKEGRFKLVHIAPDGSVSVLNDSGEKNSTTVTMQKGRNVIKIAGQAASLNKVEIRFSGLKDRDFAHIYYSEEEEYAGQILSAVQNGTVEKEKFLECIYYMEEDVVSETFQGLLKRGTEFEEDELTDIFIYSDAESSGAYLTEAIESGTVEPLSVETLSALCPYLDGKTTAALISMLPEEHFYEGLTECMPYLGEKELEDCLLAYLDAGGRLSYTQFHDIEIFLSQSTIEKLDERLNDKQTGD